MKELAKIEVVVLTPPNIDAVVVVLAAVATPPKIAGAVDCVTELAGDENNELVVAVAVDGVDGTTGEVGVDVVTAGGNDALFVAVFDDTSGTDEEALIVAAVVDEEGLAKEEEETAEVAAEVDDELLINAAPNKGEADVVTEAKLNVDDVVTEAKLKVDVVVTEAKLNVTAVVAEGVEPPKIEPDVVGNNELVITFPNPKEAQLGPAAFGDMFCTEACDWEVTTGEVDCVVLVEVPIFG